MTQTAWLEPSTASVCIYFSCSLLSGQSGIRLLKRRLRKAREWGREILTDEFSEFLCDHPNFFLLTLFTTSALRVFYFTHFQDSLPFSIASGLPTHAPHSSRCHGWEIPSCTKLTRKRLQVRLRSVFSLIPSVTALPLSPFLRGKQNVRHRDDRTDASYCSCPSHKRRLPFLWDEDPSK
jgi:hypothetical protein